MEDQLIAVPILADLLNVLRRQQVSIRATRLHRNFGGQIEDQQIATILLDLHLVQMQITNLFQILEVTHLT
jgi:hypothetical protein